MILIPSNSAGQTLLGLFLYFALTQCVDVPTRFFSDGNTRSVLDLCATTHPDLVMDIGVSAMVSDHCRVTAKVNLRKPAAKQPKTTIQVPDFENADWSGLRTVLLQTALLQAIQAQRERHTLTQRGLSGVKFSGRLSFGSSQVVISERSPNLNYG